MPGSAIAEGVAAQAAAGVLMWTELDEVVIDGDLIAVCGAMLTLQLTQRTLSSVPVGLILRFRDGRMTSEVVFICGSAQTIDVATEEVPSVDVLTRRSRIITADVCRHHGRPQPLDRPGPAEPYPRPRQFSTFSEA